MERIRISVILPVYGVEKYINNCIDSLKAQNIDGLEFLFMDDCSPDGSAAIVEACAAEDPRFRLVRQSENGGAGAARNSGIEIARGEYLSFVDPDDWMAPDFYEKLWSAAEQNPDWDIVKGKCVYIEDGTGERIHWWERFNKEIRKQLSKGKPLYLTPFHDHQAALYKASVFQDKSIRYGTSRVGEDTTFLLRFCLKTQKIGFVDDAVYYYRGQRSGALTGNFSEKRLQSELKSLEEKIDTLCGHGLDKYAFKYIRRRFYHSMIHYCMAEVNNPDVVAHEPYYRKALQEMISKIPDEEKLMEKSSEMQLLIKYDTLVPSLKEDFHSERIRRWTDFICSHTDVAGEYAKDYAVMILQSIRSRLFNKRCDLKKKGYYRTVYPQWRRLSFCFRLKVVFYMIFLPIRMTVRGIWKKIIRALGLEKDADAGMSFGG